MIPPRGKPQEVEAMTDRQSFQIAKSNNGMRENLNEIAETAKAALDDSIIGITVPAICYLTLI